MLQPSAKPGQRLQQPRPLPLQPQPQQTRLRKQLPQQQLPQQPQLSERHHLQQQLRLQLLCQAVWMAQFDQMRWSPQARPPRSSGRPRRASKIPLRSIWAPAGRRLQSFGCHSISVAAVVSWQVVASLEPLGILAEMHHNLTLTQTGWPQ